MNDITCQTCGKPLPEDAPQGMCPACLLQRTLQDSTAAPQPPGLEKQQLSAAFPQLVIEEMIGQGGMGRVYRAQQPHLNRMVALKVLSAERAGDPEWLERFSREARALARLSHPHIVQVYDFGEKPLPYLLMEHVDGVNLRQAMQDGGLTAREALTIVPKLCDALHYAHEHGVLHRDIKPENILIDTEGRVKLVDFGLAKLRGEDSVPFTLTQSGAKLGTMAYMAPEQVEKPAEVDHRADIYSLGVVFYEMLTGELPLGRFPTPSEACGVDRRLDSVVMRTLEKRKEKRFQDAAEMRTGLEKAQTGPAAKNADMMGRDMFVSVVSLALWPVASAILSFHLSLVSMVAVILSSAVLLMCGILRLRQQILQQPVQSYYPARIGALAVSAVALMTSAFWGAGLMALMMAVLWLKAMSQEAHTEQKEGGLIRGLRALWSFFTTTMTVLLIIGLTAVAHQWLNHSLGEALRKTGTTVIAVLGLLLALQTALTGLRRVWHLVRGSRPASSQGSSMEVGICAMAAVLIAPTFSNWMPMIQFNSKPVWEILAGIPATTPAKASGQAPITQLAEDARVAEKRRLAKENESIWEATNAWVANASKSDSRSSLNTVLEEIHLALKSTDQRLIRAALYALRGMNALDFDRAPFREDVRAHLKSSEPDTRVAAVWALMNVEPEPSDRQRILALVPGCTDAELGVLPLACRTLSGHDFTGEFEEAMLYFLQRAAQGESRGAGGRLDQRDVLGALWGAKFSPEIERIIIEWTHKGEDKNGVLRSSGTGYEAFYHALSVQANKSSASVRRLLELAHNSDIGNIAGRCLWGMRNNTVKDKKDQSLVAAEVISLLALRSNDYMWREGLAVLAEYATQEHTAALTELASREALPKARKEELNKVIASLHTKP